MDTETRAIAETVRQNITTEALVGIIRLLRAIAFVREDLDSCTDCGDLEVFVNESGSCAACWGPYTSTEDDALLCLYGLGLIPGDTWTSQEDVSIADVAFMRLQRLAWS